MSLGESKKYVESLDNLKTSNDYKIDAKQAVQAGKIADAIKIVRKNTGMSLFEAKEYVESL